ncbi:Uncharacterised protein [Zhongshania aliphaticivorans]|uniref:Heme exporter protein D n=1 Tax=Zhongshania aliphaticivorans TaxID=1470434 RepID=A0A5S9QB89_9GAMM|nr:heme exporter protein CcmD [Zhongshania aliphaticivorans]CAA0087793.1 Uncharacterised protein [Zhongshania aliphaticivorans]CAA0115468.1 Uncharacterised protein [Zhongshania aliphaticivorans]CAA0120236.1 Uncharacterised protein [Zhongshania aliphaticivorans]
MYFDNFAALIAMDGHGGYVWFSYGATVTILGILVIVAGQRRKQAERQIRSIVRRKKTSSFDSK